MPFADLLALATIAIEIFGGLLILFGAFIPLAAVPMIVVLLVATLTFIFLMDLARSSCNLTIQLVPILASPVTRPICFIWLR
jgi:hypothetical protein